MSTTTLLTIEQFEQLPQESGARYELKEGELIPMGLANFGHEDTKAMVLARLVLHVVPNNLGRVYSETSFALSATRVCIPDVSFLSTASIANADREHIYRGAPDLAIEIVSESESAADLREKVRDYLQAGSKAVWLLYPNLRIIAVYNEDGVRELRGGQVLEATDILPGFHTSVDELFA